MSLFNDKITIFLTLRAILVELRRQSPLRQGFDRFSLCRMAHAHWYIRSSEIRWAGHTCLLTFELDGYPRHMNERKHAFLSSWIPTFYCTMIFEISVEKRRKKKIEKRIWIFFLPHETFRKFRKKKLNSFLKRVRQGRERASVEDELIWIDANSHPYKRGIQLKNISFDSIF